jgi:hypothetical protein
VPLRPEHLLLNQGVPARPVTPESLISCRAGLNLIAALVVQGEFCQVADGTASMNCGYAHSFFFCLLALAFVTVSALTALVRVLQGVA